MPKTQSDISNTAIRIFLQKVGRFYDIERGLDVFKPSPEQKAEVYAFFDGRCAYCGRRPTADSATLDHLIPLNRVALGLHAWGNVVASCRLCNKEKHFRKWDEFLRQKSGPRFLPRRNRIRRFIKKYKYRPELGLHEIATNLYQDVGAVGMALIDLRIKQAQGVIQKVAGTARKA